MTDRLCYENIEAGFQIPTLVKRPTTRQVMKWACLTQDFHELHYDKDFAIAQGLPGVPVQGELVLSFLSQMLTDWMGDGGAIKKLGCSFRGVIFPGEDTLCKGIVSKKYVEGKDQCLECEVWAENRRGEKIVAGKAVIILCD